jgi:hypothetical protein
VRRDRSLASVSGTAYKTVTLRYPPPKASQPGVLEQPPRIGLSMAPHCAKALNPPLQSQQEAPRYWLQPAASSSDSVEHKFAEPADHEELFEKSLDQLGRLLRDRTSRPVRPRR